MGGSLDDSREGTMGTCRTFGASVTGGGVVEGVFDIDFPLARPGWMACVGNAAVFGDVLPEGD
jgi:hypothetical protein